MYCLGLSRNAKAGQVRPRPRLFIDSKQFQF